MHVARLLPASIRRAFSLMWMRLRHLLGETPILFFVVVIGVALTFRVVVGVSRDAATPEVVAPTFVTTAPAPEAASASASASTSTSTSTSTTAEVGAAAEVRPIGMPARLAPKPRGHGRRSH